MSDFENNIYSWDEWDAPVVFDPVELRRIINQLKLQGRIIKQMMFVGVCFNYYLDSEEADLRSDDEMEYRHVDIDEPFLIEFEDGDVLAIDYSDESTVKIGMNSIPLSISSRYFNEEDKRFDANIIFSDIVGGKILNVGITDSCPADYTNYFCRNVEAIPVGQISYIDRISLLIRPAKCIESNYELILSNYIDFGVIWEETYKGPAMISYKDIRRGFNDEDDEHKQ